MPLVPISQLDDPRLEPYRNLKSTNLTRWAELFIVEGEKLVRRLLESDFEVVHILAGDTYLERIAEAVPEEVPVYVVPTRMIDELIGFHFHRGLLACGRRKPAIRVDEVLEQAPLQSTCLICPDVTDPENLGTIIRISAGLGADFLVLGGRCGDPYSRRISRVSMGNNLKLPIIQTEDLESEVTRLRESGFEIAATILDPSAEPLHSAKRPKRFALMLGNEGDGLSAEWIAQADRRITIPMQNGTDSLNVAIAAAIFLHHFTSPGNWF